MPNSKQKELTYVSSVSEILINSLRKVKCKTFSTNCNLHIVETTTPNLNNCLCPVRMFRFCFLIILRGFVYPSWSPYPLCRLLHSRPKRASLKCAHPSLHYTLPTFVYSMFVVGTTLWHSNFSRTNSPAVMCAPHGATSTAAVWCVTRASGSWWYSTFRRRWVHLTRCVCVCVVVRRRITDPL